MKELPLTLENYFFTKLSIQAAAPSTVQGGDEIQIKIKHRVQVKQNKEEKDLWQLILDLNPEIVTGEYMPYNFELQVVGFFRVGPSVKLDEAGHLVYCNGASMLYSAAREFLLGVTSRFPWGDFNLPP